MSLRERTGTVVSQEFPKTDPASVQKGIPSLFNILGTSESSCRERSEPLAPDGICQAFRRKNVGKKQKNKIGPDAAEGFHRKAFKKAQRAKAAGKMLSESRAVFYVSGCVFFSGFFFNHSFPRWSPLPSLTHLSCPRIPP